MGVKVVKYKGQCRATVSGTETKLVYMYCDVPASTSLAATWHELLQDLAHSFNAEEPWVTVAWT